LRDNILTIPYPNSWALFGGIIEKGETILQGLKREIKEEINCEVTEIAYIGKFFCYPEKAEINIFRGRIKESIEKIKISEGQKAKFFKLDDIKNLHSPESLKKFIYKNKDKILFN